MKKQGFLIAQGKHIVPTEAGLSLFGVLKQADPALVDPGVTAQLECLLDDVVVGKQEMVGAIDAVCNVAERIIGKLKEGGAAGGAPLLGAAVGNGHGAFPPTPAMRRFADSLARRKGIKPPPAMAEAATLAERYEIDPAKLIEVITETLFAAPAYATYSKLIIQGEFKPGFKLTLGLKDIRLALAAGEAIGVPLPFASVVRDNLVDAIGHGDAGKDWSALALVARRRAGLGR